MNTLYYGDNLNILRRYIKDETVDLIYLDPPFNSNRNYNVLFKDESGLEADSQIMAFEDTWHWKGAAATYDDLILEGDKVSEMLQAFRSFIGENQMMAYLVMMAVRLKELHRFHKYIFVLIIMVSCGYIARSQVFMSDKDFVENNRQYSPDKSMLILNYSIDIGAFGYGKGGEAVLKTSDMSKNLKLFNLPDNLIRVKWVDNKTISARIDIIPSIRSGKDIEIRDTEVNGINVRVSPFDYIESGFHLQIEHREISPNRHLELVAYRYLKDRTALNFIHVSVIKKGGAIPKYGNYFIADMQSDRILNGTWSKENTLMFYSNSMYAQEIPYFLVHNRPDIKFEIITDDARYGRKYLWMKKDLWR